MQIKPLSVNQAYRGRRFKTTDYEAYEKEVMYQLPKITVPNGRLHLRIWVGVSSKGSDIDNLAKPFIDILQKKYGFNDNKIYELEMSKEDVKKGKEFIDFIFSAI